MKLTKRKGFNFYRSYYDVFNELNDEDKLSFIKALFDKQFLGKNPEGLTGMCKFAWISQVNSIEAQVKGYEDKTQTKLPLTDPPSVGGELPPSPQEKEKEKGEEKEKYKYINPQQFLELWNKIRTEVLNKPTFVSHVRRDIRDDLNDILKSYTKEQIETALKGLFKQTILPYENESILSSQKHIIERFGEYITAGTDMNAKLYGKTKTV